MAATRLLKVVEKCRILPPHNTVGEQSIPLTFFDMAGILFHPVHHLLHIVIKESYMIRSMEGEFQRIVGVRHDMVRRSLEEEVQQVYPTHLRTTRVGVAAVMGWIGGMFIMSRVCALLLPTETLGRELEDNNDSR
ncbi:malonyl-coenzyme A:anthocyanin 3-O-glucoside-6''-O-malonyltransferase-like protein [Tanacetum coccineum]